jgi:hypothetical protein
MRNEEIYFMPCIVNEMYLISETKGLLLIRFLNAASSKVYTASNDIM